MIPKSQLIEPSCYLVVRVKVATLQRFANKFQLKGFKHITSTFLKTAAEWVPIQHPKSHSAN